MECPMLINRMVQWNMFLLQGMPLYFSVLLRTGGIPMEHATLNTRTFQRNIFLLLGMPLYFSGASCIQLQWCKQVILTNSPMSFPLTLQSSATISYHLHLILP